MTKREEMPMATRAEVVNSIRQATETVGRTCRTLAEEHLQTRVHEGEHGWTARELLAHLAGRQVVNDCPLQLASGVGAPLGGNACRGDRYQTLVDRRLSRSRDAPLAAFQAVQEALIARAQALSDDQFARPIPPQGEMLLGELLGMAGGAHASHHAPDIEQAIARSARSRGGMDHGN
jgi:hypothetical protein